MGADDYNTDSGVEFRIGHKFRSREGVLQGVKNYSIQKSAEYRVVESDRLKYHPSYRKVWMAKQKAIAQIYGDWEESYKVLRLLQTLQSCHPGTIEAFKHCKPFISVDGMHLYGEYGGVLLITVAQDGNSNILHVAFAIVESESTDSCRGQAVSHNAAYSPRNAGYERYMDALRTLSREMADWASRFNKEIWLQHCDGGRRFGDMTTNLFECINVVLKGTRYLSISAIVRCMYERFFEWGSYVHLVYLQESELKVYEVEFPPILDEKLWPEWHGACLRPNPAMCRKATGRPIFTRFRSDIDEVDCQDKRCRLCRQTGHTRRGCLNQAIEDS
ncbi:uncharacterized protein [Arachis hypogaea]|uniref:uncharacterized protein n=1 Tax=Arachis hypogaea TaxID=3818 RepID=UPI003B21ED3D